MPQILLGFALVLGLLAAPARAESVLGKPDAPITIVEYASLTCPHCAEFHKTILPKIKESWIDTGKAKLVYRDFPLDGVALRAAMLTRCAPQDRTFAFLDTLYRQQEAWAGSRDPMAALTRLARLGGLSEQQIQECLNNQSVQDAVLQERIDGAQKFDVKGTPTVIINGKKAENAVSYEDFERLLKAASPG